MEEKELLLEIEFLSKNVADPERRIIYIFGTITDMLAREVCREVIKLTESKEPITFKINSPGGSVTAMISILSHIISNKNEIVMDIVGEACSSAAYMALAGDKIRISRFGTIMFHKPSFAIEDKVENVKLLTDATDEHFKRILKDLIKESRITLGEFNKQIDKKDWWLSPKDAKKYGFVHEIY